jgi:TonB-linked SusC/RagA family outer membrane protein
MKKNLILILFVLILPCKAFSQVTVSGVVKNTSGETLPGVSIVVKGTTNGAISDANGKYTIKNVPEKGTLVFSFVGMLTEEMAVDGRTQIDMSLADDIKTMEEVVVVGYGEQKKVHVTGSVASVKTEDIDNLPASNLGATLTGRVAGVEITGGSARPGENATIKIRNSDNWSKDGGGTTPLYIIDDVVATETDFNDLDPSDVENISILKDASAAIYGARAAAGVILVKTKRGKSGKSKITYNGSIGFSDVSMMPKMMNAEQYTHYMNDYYTVAGNKPSDPYFYTEDELDYFKTHSWNWLDEAWKTSTVSKHSLNLSGGTEKATYFASANYFYQNGNFDNNNLNKWTFRASTDVKISENLKMAASVSAKFDKNHKYLMKLSGDGSNGDWGNTLGVPPDQPPYVNGYPTASNSTSANNSANFHIFEIAKSNNFNNTDNNGYNINLSLQYNIPFIEGLSIKGQYAKTFNNDYTKQFGTYINLYVFDMEGEHNHIYGGNVTNTIKAKNYDGLYYSSVNSKSYQLNGIINYEHKFGLHNLSIVNVYEQSQSETETLTGTASSIIEGASADLGTSAASGTEDLTTSSSESAVVSVAGRADYNYSNKYIAEFSYRVDGSTKVSPQNYWAFFPSLSLGWVISEEDFFKNTFEKISYLKIRGSIGHLGQDNIKAWKWKQNYAFSTNGATFGSDSNTRNQGLSMSTQPNTDIDWDDQIKYNLGFDTKLFNSKLNLSVDGFFNHGYNLLTARTSSTAITVGGTMPEENYGIRNSFGYELSADWNKKIRNLKISISGNFSWSDDKIIKKDQSASNVGTYLDILNKSSDLGIQGYYYTGMIRTQEEADAILAKNPNYTIFGLTPAPGMLNYKDIRGPIDNATGQYSGPDGKIDTNDQDYIYHKSSNHYTFGFKIGLSWKKISMDANFSGGFGSKGMIESTATKVATDYINRPAFWSDHWTPENTNAKYPSPYYSATYAGINSSFWAVSGVEFKLNTINISYELPKIVLNKVKIESCKIFMNGINVWNIYNPYKNYKQDSEAITSYPTLRTITFGMNVSL